MIRWIAALLMLVVASVPLLAQETAPNADGVITDDEVMVVAEDMFCPICENEPLDECRNQTCIQWKEDIRRQLGEGRTKDEIINSFIDQYGEKVVGVPRDPFLQALSFSLPIIGTIIALIVGFMTFRNWTGRDPIKAKETPSSATYADDDNDYRAQLERDLR